MSKPNPNPDPADGNYRYVAERRQYGGLLIITGFCALIQPLANLAARVGPDGPLISDPGQVEFWQLVGSCCLFAIGICSMLVGYLEFIHDWGEVTQTALLIVLTQTAFIPYISDMTAVGLTMVKDPPQFFIMFPNDPAGAANLRKLNDSNEILFIGSCGILGVIAYGFAFVGAISFMQFALYAFRKGKPQDRNADYFRGRLGFYSLLLFIGGLCQILLGSISTQLNISSGGRIDGGLIRVAMFVVHFPYLTIAVGILQFLNGFWGFCRICNVGLGGRNDNYFQYSMAFLWVVVLTCQNVVQVSYLPAGMLAAAAPTFAALSFGMIFMPAYLDHKMRNTPEYMDEEYYFGKTPSPLDELMPMKKVPPGRRRIYVVERPAFVQEDAYLFDARDAPSPPTLPPPTKQQAPPRKQKRQRPSSTRTRPSRRSSPKPPPPRPSKSGPEYSQLDPPPPPPRPDGNPPPPPQPRPDGNPPPAPPRQQNDTTNKDIGDRPPPPPPPVPIEEIAITDAV